MCIMVIILIKHWINFTLWSTSDYTLPALLWPNEVTPKDSITYTYIVRWRDGDGPERRTRLNSIAQFAAFGAVH